MWWLIALGILLIISVIIGICEDGFIGAGWFFIGCVCIGMVYLCFWAFQPTDFEKACAKQDGKIITYSNEEFNGVLMDGKVCIPKIQISN